MTEKSLIYTNSKGKKFKGYLIINDSKLNGTLSYMLAVPENLEEGKELIVESLNFEGTDIIDSISQKAYKDLIDELEIIDDAPIMIPFLPDVEGGRPYYQQLSRECFVNSKQSEYTIDYPRVDLQVINSIEDAKQIIEQATSKKVAKKVFLNGYSSSGVFAQRFALIHPEIVSRALIGGAAGSIPLPTEEFPYPIGIKDFKELFGREFNEEEYKKIKFAYYVGELEAKDPAWEFDTYGNPIKRDSKGTAIDSSQIIPPMHDMSFMKRSIDTEIGILQREKLGQDIQERWKNCIEYYKQNGYSITHKIYRGAEHKGIYFKNMNLFADIVLKEMKSFYESGTEFAQDISSVEEISMKPQRERDNKTKEIEL